MNIDRMAVKQLTKQLNEVVQERDKLRADRDALAETLREALTEIRDRRTHGVPCKDVMWLRRRAERALSLSAKEGIKC